MRYSQYAIIGLLAPVLYLELLSRWGSYNFGFNFLPILMGLMICLVIGFIYTGSERRQVFLYCSVLFFFVPYYFSFIVGIAALVSLVWAGTEQIEGQKPITKEIHIVERERIFIICPYCSFKVEQGISECPNCKGKM